MTAIIDYDAGNIKSVENALHKLGDEAVTTRERDVILHADRAVLPGVGSFGSAMQQLKKYELDKVVLEVVQQQKPFLGICLGLQLLFEGSGENGGVQGLGILKGSIEKIPDAPGLKIPHIGWNRLSLQNGGRLFEGILDPYVYFVHSYYLKAKDPQIVTATAEYGVTIHASVEQGNLFACQFHPEKSSLAGLKMLQNFIKVQKGDALC